MVGNDDSCKYSLKTYKVDQNYNVHKKQIIKIYVDLIHIKKLFTYYKSLNDYITHEYV